MEQGQIWVMETVTFSAKRSKSLCSGYAVGTQYAVGVSAKRSNMGGGDHYL